MRRRGNLDIIDLGVRVTGRAALSAIFPEDLLAPIGPVESR